MSRRTPGFSLGELLVLCAILLIVAAIAVPGLISSQRASNERNASTTLKGLVSAEAEFRANDRDRNGVNDFWTADVKGLFTMTPAGTSNIPLQLIPRELAAADGDDTFYPAGGENLPLSQFAAPETMRRYWFMALLRDMTVKGTPEVDYRVDTKGTPRMGAVHNPSKFGFVAFPDSPSSGKYAFIVNENNTIFPRALVAPVRTGTSSPPGFKNVDPTFLEWPDDTNLKSYWSKID
jgi:type II secretory pathway pseudopilin PulG